LCAASALETIAADIQKKANEIAPKQLEKTIIPDLEKAGAALSTPAELAYMHDEFCRSLHVIKRVAQKRHRS
jgi:hypothetical protein